jgi:hypothetical protein
MLDGMLKRGQLCRTCYEKARECFPALKTMEEVNRFLWEATGYPMVGCEVTCSHLEDLTRESGNDCQKAIEISYRQMDDAMAKRPEATADSAPQPTRPLPPEPG